MEIELKNVKYENNKEVLLNDINITFSEKEITSIIGPSGAGKTLIGYLLVRLIDPTEGYIMLDGIRNYDINKYRKDIGYVFQNPEEIFFNKTVYEEISYGIKQLNYKLDKEQQRVKDSLKLVGLKEEILKKNPNDLSSGEKEKVAIACSLIQNPKVLILDEPTIYLDNKGKKDLIKLLKKLNRIYHKTIIIISNDIEFIYSLSNRIILLNKGKIDLNIDNKKLLENCELLKENNMEIPQIIRFIEEVRKRKNIILEPTNDINELIKDIYRHVQ